MALTSFAVHLEDDDTETFLFLMQSLGLSTPDALIRVALHNQARVSGLDVHHDAFAMPRRRQRELPLCDGN